MSEAGRHVAHCTLFDGPATSPLQCGPGHGDFTRSARRKGLILANKSHPWINRTKSRLFLDILRVWSSKNEGSPFEPFALQHQILLLVGDDRS